MRTLPVMLLFIILVQSGFGQTVVKDKYKQRQLESMVATRWGKFIPKWYYILFHNKYRQGEDRRNMLQLLPTLASVTLTEEQTEQEKEETQALYEQAVWTSFNRTVGPVYQLQYKRIFRELNTELDALLVVAQSKNVALSVIQQFRTEQTRLNGQVDILRKGFLRQGESAAGFADIEAALRQLLGMLQKFISHQQILNQYSPL